VAGAVLCSVADPARVLAEVRRVLRKSGTFLFFEHVAAPAGTWSRRLQGMCAPYTRRYDHGCDPTRTTGVAIEAAGFATVDLRRYAPSGRPTLYGVRIAGTAVN
jgi:ubiquinone/menaquinone biosynthesis C-methylase UbiE